MNSIFSISGAFAFAAIFSACAAINVARWHYRKRMWRFLFLSLPLLICFSVTLWIGVQYPNANFWWNQGFGSDWECANLGKGTAQVCFRDKPDLQTHRPVQPANTK
jgi:hypothetical protein